MSTAPAGMTQFVVKSRFGLDRDFEALGPDGQRAWFVDGKVGVRPAAEVQDAAGAVVYRLKGRLMGVPEILTVSDSEGNEVATVKAKFSPVKSRMVVTLADGIHPGLAMAVLWAVEPLWACGPRRTSQKLKQPEMHTT